MERVKGGMEKIKRGWREYRGDGLSKEGMERVKGGME
jgi:hypothetical protein